MRLSASVILPCLALGTSTFIMQASESVISICFNSSLQKIRRRYCRGSYDNPDKCYAVCYASFAGTWSGERSRSSAITMEQEAQGV